MSFMRRSRCRRSEDRAGSAGSSSCKRSGPDRARLAAARLSGADGVPFLRVPFLPVLLRAVPSLACLLAVPLPGCRTPATLAPDFSARMADTVQVPLPENRTILPLDAVVVETPLNRWIHGPAPIDVRSILASALEGVLREKGYIVVPAREEAATPDAGSPDVGAAASPAVASELGGVDAGSAARSASFELSILSWAESAASPPGFRTRLLVELREAAGGSVLYSAEDLFDLRLTVDGSARDDLSRELRRAVHSLLADLPPRSAGAGAGT
jgi:hypothetical protein